MACVGAEVFDLAERDSLEAGFAHSASSARGFCKLLFVYELGLQERVEGADLDFAC